MRNERTWELFATIDNALDEDPPLAPDGAYPTNAAFFDQIGRSLRIGIRGDFGGASQLAGHASKTDAPLARCGGDCRRVLATRTAPAHHSLAIYAPEPLELEGEIVSIAWQNPHVMIELATVGADGAPQTWRMEGGSLTTLARSGVTPELFRVGDRIKIAGRRSRREPFAGLAASILLPDGREAQMLTGAPPRFPGARMIRGADTAVGDVQAENRGIFRVWSVPSPNPVGRPRCRRCRSHRPRSRRGRRSICSTTSRRAASPKACRG